MRGGATSRTRPVGRLFDSSSGARSYAMAVPLYDAVALELPPRPPGAPPGRDAGDAARRGLHRGRGGARRRGGSFRLPAGRDRRRPSAFGCALRPHACVQPLRRLLEGIDAVGKGDLSRVILAERDDEIGSLAGRFNAMTGSLREAREEGERARAARLGAGGAPASLGEAGHHRPDGGGDRPRGGHAAERDRRAGAGPASRRPSGQRGTPADVAEERRHHQRRGRAHHQDHPAGAGLLAPARPDPDPRPRSAAVVAEALEFLRETIRRQGITVDVRTMPAPARGARGPRTRSSRSASTW